MKSHRLRTRLDSTVVLPTVSINDLLSQLYVEVAMLRLGTAMLHLKMLREKRL